MDLGTTVCIKSSLHLRRRPVLQSPRFLFQVTKPDVSEFFVAFFSQEKKRLTLVNLPQSLELTLGARLRSQFERKISSVEVADESFRVFEIRRKPNSSGSFLLTWTEALISP